MIRGVHHLAVYNKRYHHLLALLLTLLPFFAIVLIGTRGDFSTEALLVALGVSVYRLFVGFLISLIIGVALALWVGTSKQGDFFIPVFDVMQNVPSFALIPLFLLAFGYTNLMAILFVATAVVWPILFYSVTAIRTARSDWDEASRIFGARGFKRLWYYLLPVAMPAIVTGSIVGLSIGWEAVIGVEIIGLSSGIGILLTKATHDHNTTMFLAGLGLLLAFVFIINRVIWAPLLKQTHTYAD